MQPHIPPLLALPLQDFGALQKRYQALPAAARATAVLEDAEPALATAEHILAELAAHPQIGKAFAALRANDMLIGKMRPSEAKNALLDSGGDFIASIRHKLAAWKKSMERLAQGEGLEGAKGAQHLPSHAPLALALAGAASVGSYLSIVQLVLAELTGLDRAQAIHFASASAEIRRCTTVLDDCEHASSITELIH